MSLFGKTLSHIISGTTGLYLAVKLIPEVTFSGHFSVFITVGIILGLINCFIKPIIRLIAFPLRILTLGLFGLAINIIIVWTVGLIFEEITIPWFLPLLWTTLIIWIINFIFDFCFIKKK